MDGAPSFNAAGNFQKYERQSNIIEFQHIDSQWAVKNRFRYEAHMSSVELSTTGLVPNIATRIVSAMLRPKSVIKSRSAFTVMSAGLCFA